MFNSELLVIIWGHLRKNMCPKNTGFKVPWVQSSGTSVPKRTGSWRCNWCIRSRHLCGVMGFPTWQLRSGLISQRIRGVCWPGGELSGNPWSGPTQTRETEEPSGKQTYNYGLNLKSPFLMGKLYITMTIFNSDLKLITTHPKPLHHIHSSPDPWAAIALEKQTWKSSWPRHSPSAAKKMG